MCPLFCSVNREMSWWSSNQSNMINGTDGAVFHPLINRNELLYIFAADLCRYVLLLSQYICLQSKRRAGPLYLSVRKLLLSQTRYAYKSY